MINKSLLFFLILSSLNFQYSYANDKQKIIKELSKINNFIFEFEQFTNLKKENGKCNVVFDNKILCIYKDDKQKEILINGKTLVVKQKRYNKIYFYPFSKSPLSKILNKEKLINLIKNSNVVYKEKFIDLLYVDEYNQKVKVSFDKNSYELLGWETTDKFQNTIIFALKIKSINEKYNLHDFELPKQY